MNLLTTNIIGRSLSIPSMVRREKGSCNSPMSSHLLEEASKIIPNTAVLVNLVSKRVRQLTNGQKPMVEVGPRMSNADIALQEIIEGSLTFEYLTENSSAG
jgi:DNA-directed RNA polymerase subunit omega